MTRSLISSKSLPTSFKIGLSASVASNFLKNNVIVKLSFNIRCRVKNFLNSKNISKNNKTFDIVGCSPEFLKEYIEQSGSRCILLTATPYNKSYFDL